MKRKHQKVSRFFVFLLSMMLFINQLSVVTPAAALELDDIETEAAESTYEEADLQAAETEAIAAEDAIDDAGAIAEDDETSIEIERNSRKVSPAEEGQAYDGAAPETVEEIAETADISSAVSADEEVQKLRGPPASANAEAGVLAAEDGTRAEKTVTVLGFTSDIHNGGDNIAANRQDSWIDKIVNIYGGLDVMSFCGDMGSAGANESQFWTYTQSVVNVINDHGLTGVYTTGNHEFYNGQFSSTTNAVKNIYIKNQVGLVGDNYIIYCLGTNSWDGRGDSYDTSQVTELESFLNSTGNDKPIIILTHFPLHRFSSRQSTNADRIIDTLNAAVNGNNQKIVLLWGHNHTMSDTNYDEVFVPGESITYNSSGASKTISFYYAAAGCMSDTEYTGSGSAYVKGKGLVITIDSDNLLTFTYYDANANDVTEGGSYTEGDEGGGHGDPSGGGEGGSDDETGQGVMPEDGKKYVILASDGYALTSEGDEVGYSNGSSGSQVYNYKGLTGEEYTVGENVAPDRLLWTFIESEDKTGFYIQSNDGKYLNGTYEPNDSGGYDGTLKLDSTRDVWIITGASSGSTVNAHILKSTNASQSDAGDKYLTHGNGDGSVANIFALRSESNATEAIFYEYSDDGTYIDHGDEPAPVQSDLFEETDHFEAGKEYIVAVTKDDSSVYAINKSSSSVTSATLELTPASGDDPAVISTKQAGVIWKYDSSKNLTNGSDYFYPTSSNGIMTYTSGRAIDYADGKMSFETSSSGTYYITFSGSSFGTSGSEGDAAQIRIFVRTEGSAPDDPDDPTPVEGSVYKLVDQFTDGGEYLIVSANSAGSAYALNNPGGSSGGASMGQASVTIKSGDVDEDGEADLYISSDAAGIIWKAAANADGFNLTNGSDYLEGKSGNVSIFSSQQYADRYWTYAGSQLQHVGGSNTYTVYYDGGFVSTYSSNSNTIYIYEKVDGAVPDDPDDPTPVEGDVYEETNSLEDGKEYIIAVTKDDGSVYAINKSGSSVTAVTLEVAPASGDDPATITTDNTGVVWKYASATKYLTNGSDYFYPSSSNGIMTYSSGRAIDYADGKMSFETSSSGTYYITFSGGSFNTSSDEGNAAQIRLFVKAEGDTPDDPTPGEGQAYKLVDQFTDGKEYLIVSANSAGSAYALNNPGGSSGGASMGSASVTIVNGDADGDGQADLYINSDAAGIVWKAAANADGFNLTNGSDYLEGKSGNVSIFSSQQYADRYWTYAGSQLQHVGGSNTYTVYYDSGFKSTYSSNSNTIYIYEKVEEAPPVHEHTWDEGVVTTEPTCEEPGVKTYTCAECGETYTEEIPALGHAYGEPAYEWAEDNSTVTATMVCAHDASHVVTETAATTSVITDATCEEDGTAVYTADFENEAFAQQTKTVTIPALGHTLIHVEAKAATKQEDGNIEYWYCEVCGKYFADAEATVEITQEDTIVHWEGIDAESIAVDPVSTEMITSHTGAGDSTLALTVTALPEGADLPELIWTSSDETIATVDESGLVTALRYGLVTITASAAEDSTMTASCQIQTRYYDVCGSPDREDPDYEYWFTPVYWAADKAITKGYDNVYFGPEENCTREQMITFLYREAGSPAVSAADIQKYNTFSDVSSSANPYYLRPVVWAAKNGITKGYSSGEHAGKFGVGLPVTREDTMTFIYRMAGKPKYSTTKSFTDVKKGAYYYDAVLWGVTNGITNGYSSGPNAGKFGVGFDVLRKDIVTFLYRYDTKFN